MHGAGPPVARILLFGAVDVVLAALHKQCHPLAASLVLQLRRKKGKQGRGGGGKAAGVIDSA